MELYLNNKILNFLKQLELSNNSDILITNLNNLIYSSNNAKYKNGITVSRELLKTLLQSNIKIIVRYNKSLITIFDNTSINCVSQIILPLKQNEDCYGAIILLNSNKKFNKKTIDFLYTVKKNIEFLLDESNNKKIKKYNENPLYNSVLMKSITDITDKYINELIIDKNYQNLINLLHIKIETLETNLAPNTKKLLNEIIDLFKQEKEFHTLYGAILGANFKNLSDN